MPNPKCTTPPDSWTAAVEEAAALVGTPLYLIDEKRLVAQARELWQSLPAPLYRHWFSFKTQPVPRVAQTLLSLGFGLEVVSEFELRGALRLCEDPRDILVNGTSKASWLPRDLPTEITVVFDSVAEARELGIYAARNGWRVGCRVDVTQARDPDAPEFGTQFGIAPTELPEAVSVIRSVGLEPSVVHCHLQTRVPRPELYVTATNECALACASADWQPKFLDLGGGFPSPGERLLDETWSASTGNEVIDVARGIIPSVEEVWLENGRAVSATAAVLVVRVHDVKHRSGMRFVLCDGGRVNHALVSDWEEHNITVIGSSDSEHVPTTIAGPTCMPFDHLARTTLPGELPKGSLIVWHGAGAYHIPWETMFSHPFCAVVYARADGHLEVHRTRQTFSEWWGRWLPG